jgi:cohesin loading factor subunit SCC2
MHHKCREFATLLSIDDEFRVDADEDAEGDSLDAIGEDDTGTALTGSRPMKRKNSVSSSNLNKRPKSRKGSTGRKKSSEPDDELAWD